MRVWRASRFEVVSNQINITSFAIRYARRSFVTPPQACSVTIDASGKVSKYTIGHVMDRSVGNTGGLGGIFGPLVAIGKPLPFPEARPYKPSWTSLTSSRDSAGTITNEYYCCSCSCCC